MRSDPEPRAPRSILYRQVFPHLWIQERMGVGVEDRISMDLGCHFLCRNGSGFWTSHPSISSLFLIHHFACSASAMAHLHPAPLGLEEA